MVTVLSFTIVIAALLGSIVITFARKAVLFSKITFALFAALVANGHSPIIADNGLLSYLIWFAIFIAACLLLCLAPRINFAFLFLCNSVITYVIAIIAISILHTHIFDNYELTVPVEVAVKLVCLILSVYALLRQIRSTESIKDTEIRILITIQRIIASLLYAIAVVFLVSVSFYNLYELSLLINILIFVFSFILAYIFDVILFERMREYGNTFNPLSLLKSGNVNLTNILTSDVSREEIEEMFREDAEDRRDFEREQTEAEDRWHNDWMDRAARDDDERYYGY